MKKKNNSDWDNLKEFLNNYGLFFRYGDIPDDVKSVSTRTYINYLFKAGFLERLSAGLYELQYKIDDNITIERCLEYAYGKKKGHLLKLIKQNKLNKKLKKVKHANLF